MDKPKHMQQRRGGPSDNRAPGAAPPSVKNPTHWGKVADWYDELVGDEGSEYQREVIWPGLLRMLDLKRGEEGKKLAILDLACGQGAWCRKLAGMGHAVVGVDAAKELIEAAAARHEAGGADVRYVVADVTKLVDEAGGQVTGELAGRTFDAATLVLAIQNITPLSPVWKACHALLKPGGVLVVVMMHPAFRIPRQSDWLWDEKTQTQGRLVRQYLGSSQIAIQTHPGLAAHGKSSTTTAHFHRPLQAYINTLGNAGLLIDHIEEWASHKKSEPGPRQKALDAARKEFPMFMAVRARRV